MKYKVYKSRDELKLVEEINKDLEKYNKPMTVGDSHEVINIIFDGTYYVAFVKCLV